MIVCIKILLGIVLIALTFQDFKERQVSSYLLVVFPLLGGYLFFHNTTTHFYLISVFMSSIILFTLLLILFIIIRWVFRKSWKESIGIGDVLFFFGMVLCFPTMSFLNFFLFAILCTFIIHLLFSSILKNWNATVPLAGGMAVFLGFIYVSHWMGMYPNIYLL